MEIALTDAAEEEAAYCTYHSISHTQSGIGVLMRTFLACKTKKPLHTGVRTGFHYLVSLSVCLSLYCVCVTFVFSTDCESCTRPTSTNPGSMTAGEDELMRGTCPVALHLRVVAVAGLLWILWCVLGAAGFFFFAVYFSSNAHGLLQV